MLRKAVPITLGCDVRIEGDNIAVTGLSLRDAELAAYVGEHPEVDRPAVIERGLAESRDRADVVDAAAVRRDLHGIRVQLNAIAGTKSKLTSISTATGDVRNALGGLRQGVLDRVVSIEGNVADVAASVTRRRVR